MKKRIADIEIHRANHGDHDCVVRAKVDVETASEPRGSPVTGATFGKGRGGVN